MKARDLMTKDIEVCTLNNSAADAISIMKRKNCGFVPVVLDQNNRTLTGVLTDRDAALFLGESKRPASDVKVREFYTRTPKTVPENADLHDVVQLMEEQQIHRVPVTDETGKKLLGIISLKDLAQEARMERGSQKPGVSEAEIGEIIETIAGTP